MDYISGWCRSQRMLYGTTVIVTGANGGMGKEITADLYTRGARVIMACRDLPNAEAVKRDIILDNTVINKDTGYIVIEELDLCSLASVRAFAQRVLAKKERLQLLINNAGVMCCPEGRTKDGFETHLGSNHLGHALLTLLLLPKLIESAESASSRIIFVSSAVHYFTKIDFSDMNYSKTTYHPLQAYSRSKIANILFAKALARNLEKHNIKNVTTYSVHPGIVYTQIDRYIWRPLSWCFRLWLLRWMWKSPRCGAQTAIYCAVDERCAGQTGLYYSDCCRRPTSPFCNNDKNVTRLWNLTLEMLGFNPEVFFLSNTDSIAGTDLK